MRRLLLFVSGLLAIAAAAMVGWFAAGAEYKPLLAAADAQVRQLNDLIDTRNAVIRNQQQRVAELSGRLDRYKAELAGAASGKADETIAKLKAELDAVEKAAQQEAQTPAKPAPRDPAALYQNGRIVAMVRGAIPDPRAGTIGFSAITSESEIALPATFDYMQWKLHCEDSGLKAVTSLAAKREINYYRVQCKMQ